MFMVNYGQPPAIVRSIEHPSMQRSSVSRSAKLVRTMFGTMVYPTAAETNSNYENEGITAKREYSTNTPYGKYNSNYNSTLSCSQILNNEINAGDIPAGEFCSCPTGATTPQCYNDNAQICQELLTADEANPKIEDYYSCKCATGSGTPTCTSYYKLCEDNLPTYTSKYPDDECTCSNPDTTATPNCVSYYQLCEDNLSTVQADNPDDVCSCTDPQTTANPSCESDYDVCTSAADADMASNPYQVCTCSDTSPTPSCESYYDICESAASGYENSDTSCSCSQTSTHPYCCTTTTTQQCSGSTQTPDGWSCPSSMTVCGRYCQSGVPYNGGCCSAPYGVANGCTPINGSNPLPQNLCGGSKPICNYYSSNINGSAWGGGQYATQAYTSTESCHNVTTKSCKTE